MRGFAVRRNRERASVTLVEQRADRPTTVIPDLIRDPAIFSRPE